MKYGSDVKGASRKLPARDMDRKVRPSRTLPEPTSEMPQSSGKPKADWPRDPMKATSGKA